MDNDDLPVGRVLTRREAVKVIAMSGAGVLLGCQRAASSAADSATVAAAGTSSGTSATTASLPGCVVRPELTVGPYFVDKQLDRSDIRVEPKTGVPRPGAPLALTFNVSRIDKASCAPLAGAMIDVWHCDGNGTYSGVNDPQFGGTVGEKYCRGYQVTDANGVARFTTIFPGWYHGRTVHVHFMIRNPASAVLSSAGGSVYEFTSQLFFDEAVIAKVHAQAPYAAKGNRDTRNADDGIYRGGGSQLLLTVAQAPQGYSANFDVGLDLSDAKVGAPDTDGGPGGSGGLRGPGGPGGPPPGGRRPPSPAS